MAYTKYATFKNSPLATPVSLPYIDHPIQLQKALSPSFRQSTAVQIGQPNTFPESNLSILPISSASSSDCLKKTLFQQVF